MDNKLAGYLGIAQRARKLLIGETAMKAIQSKEAKLVLIAEDCSLNTQKKILDKCTTYQVEVIKIAHSADLSYAIGRGHIVLVAISDDGFAKAIRNCLK